MKLRSSQSGFTVVEIIVAIVIAIFAVGLFWVQKSDIEARGHDELAKQDINAIYHYLNDIEYHRKGGYPVQLSADKLPGLNPESLIDPNGNPINEGNYHYEAQSCKDNICQSYDLSADLEKEAEYVKTSPIR